jgi:hypothetical protein
VVHEFLLVGEVGYHVVQEFVERVLHIVQTERFDKREQMAMLCIDLIDTNFEPITPFNDEPRTSSHFQTSCLLIFKNTAAQCLINAGLLA